MKYYVLRKVGTGAIAYNTDRTAIYTQYIEETDNGKYSGYSVSEVEIPEYFFNLGTVEFWKELSKIA